MSIISQITSHLAYLTYLPADFFGYLSAFPLTHFEMGWFGGSSFDNQNNDLASH